MGVVVDAHRSQLAVSEAARALVLAAERADTSGPFNLGTGLEARIRDLAGTIREVAGYEGETACDTSRPDGRPVRHLGVSRARKPAQTRAPSEAACSRK